MHLPSMQMLYGDSLDERAKGASKLAQLFRDANCLEVGVVQGFRGLCIGIGFTIARVLTWLRFATFVHPLP